MKHITPQAQNHIFKERSNKPTPFQETTSFITLDELKVLENEGKFSMNSDSDGDDCMDDENDVTDVNEKNDTLTNDETFTNDGKETYEGEEDETYEDEEELGDVEENGDVEEVHERINEEELRQELTKIKTPSRPTSKRSKKLKFTMQYELVENTW